jgi:hypothetical protein
MKLSNFKKRKRESRKRKEKEGVEKGTGGCRKTKTDTRLNKSAQNERSC